MLSRYLIITSFVFSCKSTRVSENKEIQNQKEVSIFVLSGGFSSCPNEGTIDKAMRAAKTSDMYSIFNKFEFKKLGNLNTQNKSRIFSTCYTGPAPLLDNYTFKITGRYAWNQGNLTDSKTLGVKTFDVLQNADLLTPSFLSDIKIELQSEIKNLENEGFKVSLYLFGHSYGGFTAIQLADFFSKQFRGLITIDPISMLTCQAQSMMLEPFQTVFLKHPGCLNFPNDSFSENSTKNILERVNSLNSNSWWLHYYQDKFPFLHSGPLPTKTFSKFPETFYFDDFPNALTNGGYHSYMGKSEVLWQKIYRQMSSKINESSTL